VAEGDFVWDSRGRGGGGVVLEAALWVCFCEGGCKECLGVVLDDACPVERVVFFVDPCVGDVAEFCAKDGEVCFDFLVWV